MENNSRPHERIRCHAHNREGQQCGRFCAPGKTVCNLHGGKSKSGAEAGGFVYGRRTRRLPSRLQPRVDAALADPELLSRRHDLAVIEARLQELFDNLDKGGSPAIWDELQASWREVVTSKSPAALMAHGAVISRGSQDADTWRDILSTLKVRDRIALGEQRRLMQMQMMIDANEALTMVRFLIDTVRRYVTDTDALDGIIGDIEGYVVGATSGGIAESSRTR